MQFSDTSGGQGIIQDISFTTGASLTEYLLSDRTRNINNWARTVLIDILSSQAEWDFDDSNYTDFPILTTDLTSGQRDYSLPLTTEEMLSIKSLEVTYDGTNWYKATPIDSSEINTATSDDGIDSFFSKAEPRYDFQYGSIFLYPKPTASVSGGLKIFIYRDINPFTVSDTTKIPGFDAGFHKILSLGASFDWSFARGADNKNDLYQQIQELRKELKNFYSSKQTDRQDKIKSSNRNYNWR